ncbi:MAG: hypothetical protein ACLFU8_13030 [Anaerolineales bacterium]
MPVAGKQSDNPMREDSAESERDRHLLLHYLTQLHDQLTDLGYKVEPLVFEPVATEEEWEQRAREIEREHKGVMV